jgi:ATP adenylyltransferase
MDFLWSPWRYRYVTGAPEACARQGCVFCRIVDASVPDRQSAILPRAEHNFVILNRYPYTSGHMLVVPCQHVAKLAAASRDAASQMIELTHRIECGLDRLYRPDGINVGMNVVRPAGAGVADHIHMHALPRWSADSNCATVIGATRVPPEALEVRWERAKAEFERS